jgi:Rieske Fe-S protein
MFRRTFLISGLMLLGFGRRAWARFTGATNYLPLTRRVRIPLDQVAQAWRPAPFVEGVSPTTAARPGRRVLLSGVLFRRATGDDRPELSALCLTCPHEQCPVRLVTDPTQLARITGRTGSHPLFEGGCHGSVFDAMDDGARVSGLTPRRLYRFRVGSVRDGIVEITEVEEDALSEA